MGHIWNSFQNVLALSADSCDTNKTTAKHGCRTLDGEVLNDENASAELLPQLVLMMTVQ